MRASDAAAASDAADPGRRHRGLKPRVGVACRSSPSLRPRHATPPVPHSGRTDPADAGTLEPMTAPPETPDALDAVAGWLRDAQRIVILTGAGISTDSGIPDFRGPHGLWTKNPEAEKTATLQHYVADPEVRKQAWQNRLRSEIWNAEPNDGAPRGGGAGTRVAPVDTLVTQNIDGLHQAAGQRPGDDHRDPRHRALRQVPGVRLAGTDGRDARPGPGG